MSLKSSSVSSRSPKYTFHNEDRWYFRHQSVGVHRLPGAPLDPEFHRAYAERLAQISERKKEAGRSYHALASLIDRFQKSPEYQSLAPSTRASYDPHLLYISNKVGNTDWRTIEKKHVIALRNSRSEAPRQADYLVTVLSALFTWLGDQAEMEEATVVNPCRGVKKLHRNVVGHLPWTEAQIEHFLANCKPEFVIAIMLGLYTGQRIGDVIPMKRTAYLGDTIQCITNKTKEYLEISVHPNLKKALDARPHPLAETLVTTPHGRPYKLPSSFSSKLTVEVKRLGLPKLTFHGLRYAASARLEDAGCKPWEIQDIVGHRTFAMSEQYATKRRLQTRERGDSSKSATPPRKSAT